MVFYPPTHTGVLLRPSDMLYRAAEGETLGRTFQE